MKLFLFPLLFICTNALADEMNLNEFAPTHLEDASPTEENKLDLQLSSAFEEQEGAEEMIYQFNPRYGLNKNTQVEALGKIFSGGEERGSGEVKVGGLYKVTDFKNMMPNLSLMPFIVAPTGKYQQGVGYEVKLALTSTLRGTSELPLHQWHLNLGQAYSPHPSSKEQFYRGLASLGFSHRLDHQAAIVFDVFHEQDRERGEETNFLELGLQKNTATHLMLALGVSAAVGAGPSWGTHLSLIKQI